MLSVTPRELIDELCGSCVANVKYFVKGLYDIEDKTLSSISSVLNNNIVCFATDEKLISALSRKDNIKPTNLEGKSIHIPEYLLSQWKTLFTLIINQFLTHFEKRDENNENPILFMLDEFPRLGKVPSMPFPKRSVCKVSLRFLGIVQSFISLVKSKSLPLMPSVSNQKM
jgi:type IV secretion system protein VirD4